MPAHPRHLHQAGSTPRPLHRVRSGGQLECTGVAAGGRQAVGLPVAVAGEWEAFGHPGQQVCTGACQHPPAFVRTAGAGGSFEPQRTMTSTMRRGREPLYGLAPSRRARARTCRGRQLRGRLKGLQEGRAELPGQQRRQQQQQQQRQRAAGGRCGQRQRGQQQLLGRLGGRRGRGRHRQRRRKHWRCSWRQQHQCSSSWRRRRRCCGPAS